MTASVVCLLFFFFFSSRRRHTRSLCDWSSDVCSSDLDGGGASISAQWFDANGTALTGEFVIIREFQAGPNTWFETAPLIGGGLVVRRSEERRVGKECRSRWAA